MLRKAIGSAATVLCPDMEDSVPLSGKEEARDRIVSLLPEMNKAEGMLFPRVNGPETPFFNQDIESLMSQRTQIDGICVPMVNNVEQVHQLPKEVPLIVQIETTEAVSNLRDILRDDSRNIVAACFGADDFLTDFGIQRDHSKDQELLHFARCSIALESRAHGVISIDTPYVHFKNPEGLKSEISYLKTIGMKAKMAIHPLQVDIINEGFSLSKEEIEYAQRLVSAFEEAMAEGKGAIDFENKMVDVPVYKRMLLTLKEAGVQD